MKEHGLLYGHESRPQEQEELTGYSLARLGL